MYLLPGGSIQRALGFGGIGAIVIFSQRKAEEATRRAEALVESALRIAEGMAGGNHDGAAQNSAQVIPIRTLAQAVTPMHAGEPLALSHLFRPGQAKHRPRRVS